VGALLALGFARGRGPGEGDEAKTRCYGLSELVVEGFRERFGSLTCRDLLGIDMRTQEGRDAFAARDYHHTRCSGFVTETTKTTAGIISKAFRGLAFGDAETFEGKYK
jgi:hypothetical protein